MTILDRIIEIVKEKGAITLQEIYKELYDLKKTVIRGTINRYIRRKDKKIDRITRGTYVSIEINKDDTTNILNFKHIYANKKMSERINSKILTRNLNKQIVCSMVSGLEGQISFDNLEMQTLDVQDDENYLIDSICSEDYLFNDKINSDIYIDYNNEYPIEYFDNKVFNEDTREFIKKIPSNSIDLIVTDIPYLTTKRGIGKRTTTGGMTISKLGRQGKIFEDNCVNIKEYIHDFFRVLKDGTHCYIMTNQKNLVEILNETLNAGFKFISSLIWKKNNKCPGPNYYMSQFEYILFFKKGKFRRINNCGTSDILEFDNKKIRVPELDEQGNSVLTEKGKIKYRNLHNTEKPVGLMRVLVENSSNVKDRVLDTFSGIGATAIACKELGRTYICNEINKVYRDISINRLNTVTI